MEPAGEASSRDEKALQSRWQSIQSARPRGAKDKAPRCVQNCILVRPYPRCRVRSAHPRTERGAGAADGYVGGAGSGGLWRLTMWSARFRQGLERQAPAGRSGEREIGLQNLVDVKSPPREPPALERKLKGLSLGLTLACRRFLSSTSDAAGFRFPLSPDKLSQPACVHGLEAAFD